MIMVLSTSLAPLRTGHAAPHVPPTQSEVDQARTNAALGRAEELYLEGSALYTAADYVGAIRAFTDALKVVTREGGLSPSVRGGLIFNLAQAHIRAHGIDRDLSHLRQARDLYKRLLDEADEIGYTAEDQQRTQMLLDEIEGKLAETATPKTPAAQPPTPAVARPAHIEPGKSPHKVPKKRDPNRQLGDLHTKLPMQLQLLRCHRPW